MIVYIQSILLEYKIEIKIIIIIIIIIIISTIYVASLRI